MSEFDGYYKWLGIPPKDQPPNHYRLLSLQDFESDEEVIDTAADRQSSHVRKYQNGPHALLSQQLLNEIAKARLCLLQPVVKEEYDRTLQDESREPLVTRPLPLKPASRNPSGGELLPAVPMSAPASQSETPQPPDLPLPTPPPSLPDQPPASFAHRLGYNLSNLLSRFFLPTISLQSKSQQKPPGLTPETQPKQAHADSVAAIKKLGGTIKENDNPHRMAVELNNSKVTDSDLLHLKGLTKLTGLLIDASITDAGLVHLKGLTELIALRLINTNITDAGLEHLKGLTKLKALDLYKTKITGAGLVHLKGLTELTELELNDTQVTDAGWCTSKG